MLQEPVSGRMIEGASVVIRNPHHSCYAEPRPLAETWPALLQRLAFHMFHNVESSTVLYYRFDYRWQGYDRHVFDEEDGKRLCRLFAVRPFCNILLTHTKSSSCKRRSTK
jgi:hypothetical protein